MLHGSSARQRLAAVTGPPQNEVISGQSLAKRQAPSGSTVPVSLLAAASWVAWASGVAASWPESELATFAPHAVRESMTTRREE
jgi:hypothetical protein